MLPPTGCGKNDSYKIGNVGNCCIFGASLKEYYRDNGVAFCFRKYESTKYCIVFAEDLQERKNHSLDELM